MISSDFLGFKGRGKGDPEFLVGTGVPGVLGVLGVLEIRRVPGSGEFLEFREPSRPIGPLVGLESPEGLRSPGCLGSP